VVAVPVLAGGAARQLAPFGTQYDNRCALDGDMMEDSDTGTETCHRGKIEFAALLVLTGWPPGVIRGTTRKFDAAGVCTGEIGWNDAAACPILIGVSGTN